MKHIFQLFSFEEMKRNILGAISRFPFSFFCIVVFVGVFFGLLHDVFGTGLEDLLGRIIFSLIVTFFLSIGMVLCGESFEVSSGKKLFLSALSGVFGLLFFATFSLDFNSLDNLVYFIITLVGTLSFLFFAAYIREIRKYKISKTQYFHYFYEMSVVFFLSSILGGVLCILGFIGIGTINTLFGTSFDTLFGDWAILSLAFFAPVFSLTQIPKKEEITSKEMSQNAFFSFLIKYIALPFLAFYFAILYIYSGKVLLNFSDWPKGEVSWMVIGFSTFGYLFYIFSSRLEEEMKMIELARKYFPYIVLPQIAMLFYALYLRIAQYDVTMNRYFVAVFGLWLCVISLYYIFSQKKYLIFIPAVFAIFTLLISIGPWSVYDFPEYRQKQKLIENLTALHIYENGTIKALSGEYSNEDLENQAYSGISYLCSLNNCKSIKELFPEQYEAFLIQHKEQFEKDTAQGIEDNKNYPEGQKYWNEREYTLPQPWEIVAAITSALGIDIYRSGESYTSYSLGEAGFFPLSVQGYDMIIPVTQSKVNEKIYGKYDEGQETLQIYDGENIIESISLGNYFMELNKSETLLNNAMSPESMTYTFTGQRFDGKILFESISIQDNTLGQESTDSNIQYMSGYISGYVLLKQK